ncbi:hypothetical protein LXL04_016060 [Taraxacum kok-saghyz]
MDVYDISQQVKSVSQKSTLWSKSNTRAARHLLLVSRYYHLDRLVNGPSHVADTLAHPTILNDKIVAISEKCCAVHGSRRQALFSHRELGQNRFLHLNRLIHSSTASGSSSICS